MLDVIYKSTIRLLKSQTLEQTYEAVTREAMLLVKAKYGSIFVPKRGRMERVYTTDSKLYQIKPRKNGNTAKAFQQQQPYMLGGHSLSSIHSEFKKFHIGGDITIPLSYDKEKLGVLSVLADKNKMFTLEDLKKLRVFGPVASLALINSSLYSKFKEAIATRDLFQ